MTDAGSFAEVGGLTGRGEYDEAGQLIGFTPSNIVLGNATVDHRPVVVTGYDFTVRGGASDASVGHKRPYADRMALEQRVPLIRLLEGAGGSVKSIESMGVSYVSEIVGWDDAVRCLSTVPVVAAALGPVAGLPAAEVPASHFSVMVKGASQVFSAGPPLVQHATGETVTKEELGGWEVCTRAGTVDNAVDTEDDALEEVRRFLSYLPSHVWQLPARRRRRPTTRAGAISGCATPSPRRAGPSTPAASCARSATRAPSSRSEPASARSVVGALARIDGHPVAVLGTDARFDGAGFTTEAAEKLCRFVDLADTFHLPVVYFVDNPGVMIGTAAEHAGTLRAGCRALSAVHETRVPWASVLVRRCFGVGGATHRNTARHSLRVAWPSGIVGLAAARGRRRGRLQARHRGVARPRAGARRAARAPAGRALAVPHGRELLGRGHHRPGRHAAGARPLGAHRLPHVGGGSRSDRRAGRSGPDRPRPHRSVDPEERQVGLAVERGLEAADAVGERVDVRHMGQRDEHRFLLGDVDDVVERRGPGLQVGVDT